MSRYEGKEKKIILYHFTIITPLIFYFYRNSININWKKNYISYQITGECTLKYINSGKKLINPNGKN